MTLDYQTHSFDFNLAHYGHSEGEAFQELCPRAQKGDILVVYHGGQRASRQLLHVALADLSGFEGPDAVDAITAEWSLLVASNQDKDVVSAIDVFVVPHDGVRGALRGGVYNLNLALGNDQARLHRALASMYARMVTAHAETGVHVRDLIMAV